MSAPAMKALVPEPVRVTTPTEGSPAQASSACAISRRVAEFSALSFSGRFTVRTATRSRISRIRFSKFMGLLAPRCNESVSEVVLRNRRILRIVVEALARLPPQHSGQDHPPEQGRGREAGFLELLEHDA